MPKPSPNKSSATQKAFLEPRSQAKPRLPPTVSSSDGVIASSGDVAHAVAFLKNLASGDDAAWGDVGVGLLADDCPAHLRNLKAVLGSPNHLRSLASELSVTEDVALSACVEQLESLLPLARTTAAGLARIAGLRESKRHKLASTTMSTAVAVLEQVRELIGSSTRSGKTPSNAACSPQPPLEEVQRASSRIFAIFAPTVERALDSTKADEREMEDELPKSGKDLLLRMKRSSSFCSVVAIAAFLSMPTWLPAEAVLIAGAKIASLFGCSTLSTAFAEWARRKGMNLRKARDRRNAAKRQSPDATTEAEYYSRAQQIDVRLARSLAIQVLEELAVPSGMAKEVFNFREGDGRKHPLNVLSSEDDDNLGTGKPKRRAPRFDHRGIRAERRNADRMTRPPSEWESLRKGK